jgi:hypothetical protein
VTLEKITQRHKAICEVVVIIERDLLAISSDRTSFRCCRATTLPSSILVPADKLTALRNFWHAQNDIINGRVHVQRVI